MDDKVMGVLLIKSLEINKGLTDELFDPDKVEVKGFNIDEPSRLSWNCLWSDHSQ